MNNQVTYGFVPEPQKRQKGQNEKYLGTSKIGDYFLRFLGSPHKFYFHYRADGRKICPKSLTIRTPEIRDANGEIIKPGGYMYTKTDPNTGEQVPYTAEETHCPICDQGDSPRKRFVINAIDLKELTERQKMGLPPVVRIMEFPKQVWDYLIQYNNAFRVMPSDPVQGSNFRLQTFYPDKLNCQPRDIIYKLTWDKPGEKPLPKEVTCYIENGNVHLWDLIKEYHPLLQKKQSVFPQPDDVKTVPPMDSQGFVVPSSIATPPPQPQVYASPVAAPAPIIQAPAPPPVQSYTAPQTHAQAPQSGMLTFGDDGDGEVPQFETMPNFASPVAQPVAQPVQQVPQAAPQAAPAQSNNNLNELESLLASLQTNQ